MSEIEIELPLLNTLFKKSQARLNSLSGVPPRTEGQPQTTQVLGAEPKNEEDSSEEEDDPINNNKNILLPL